MCSAKSLDTDLYDVLGLTIDATSSDIRSAYKKKALKCHPDKNPDDPRAGELFLQLTKSIEVLLDPTARASYDKLLKAHQAARLRHKALDEKRKRFKEDLEAREQADAFHGVDQEKKKMEREIERLRKEGAALIQEEIRLLQKQVIDDLNAPVMNLGECQLKVTWKCGDDIYTEKSLSKIFSKYGDVVAVAVLKGKALIEFEDKNAAALAARIEIGFANNPLKVKLADSKTQKEATKKTESRNEFAASRGKSNNERELERRKIIEEMMRQDELEKNSN